MTAPPLLVSFDNVEDLLRAVGPDLDDDERLDVQSLTAAGLPPATSLEVISTAFGISPSFLQTIVRRPERFYRSFEIRKGNKLRQIRAPRISLKLLQAWIGYHLTRSVKAHHCVFGFVPGRSAPMAAQRHSGANWVYSLDLKDFFPSTGLSRIIPALEDLGYSPTASRLVGDICTLAGFLPQGSPASPVLSNLVFGSYDSQLSFLADSHGVTYTRYADDIVFSGKESIPTDLQESVKEIISLSGYTLAEKKEKLSLLPGRLKVHGLVVHGSHPRLTKGYRNRIRAYKHVLEANPTTLKKRAQILGHLAYAKSVENLEKMPDPRLDGND